MDFTILPALDLRNGQVVRLLQGDFTKQTSYDASPVVLARRYADAGARWLHLVDLDAARRGGYSLQPLLRELRGETALSIQTGGGLRDADGIEALLALGVARVVVGTAAIRDPERATQW